jgi:nitrogen fixation protein FixH
MAVIMFTLLLAVSLAAVMVLFVVAAWNGLASDESFEAQQEKNRTLAREISAPAGWTVDRLTDDCAVPVACSDPTVTLSFAPKDGTGTSIKQVCETITDWVQQGDVKVCVDTLTSSDDGFARWSPAQGVAIVQTADDTGEVTSRIVVAVNGLAEADPEPATF